MYRINVKNTKIGLILFDEIEIIIKICAAWNIFLKIVLWTILRKTNLIWKTWSADQAYNDDIKWL